MKLIDTFFCLIYRIGVELYLYDKKESKFLAYGFFTAWCIGVIYDCYWYLIRNVGLWTNYPEYRPRDFNMFLIPIIGILLWIRYYRCKKNITQEFDERYKTWHPDKREFCRILTIVILISPCIVLFLI